MEWTTTSIETEKEIDTNPDLYMRRAEDALKRSDVSAALDECDKAIFYSNNNSAYLFEKARILLACELYEQCMSLIKKHMYSFKKSFNKEKLAMVYLYLHCCHFSKPYQEGQTYTTKKFHQYTYYVGKIGQGVPNQHGVMYYEDNYVYAGDFCLGKREGRGTLFHDGDMVYNGRWKKDRKYNPIFGFLNIILVIGLIIGSLYYLHSKQDMIINWVLDKGDFTSSQNFVEETPPYYEQLFITVNAANIRFGPSLNAEVITVVYPNEVILYIGEDQYDVEGQIWYNVVLEDGTLGWISGSIVDRQYIYHEDESDYFYPEHGEVYEEINYDSGVRYYGELVNGIPNGYGTFYWPDGTVYEGEVYEGQMYGYGQLTWNDGYYYSGQFVNGIIEGYGAYFYSNGELHYEGYFENGEYVNQ